MIETAENGWSEMLDRHDQLPFGGCHNSGGDIEKRSGDALLARFDDPTARVAGMIRRNDADSTRTGSNTDATSVHVTSETAPKPVHH